MRNKPLWEGVRVHGVLVRRVVRRDGRLGTWEAENWTLDRSTSGDLASFEVGVDIADCD